MTNGSDWTTAGDAPTRSYDSPAAPAITLHPGQRFGPYTIVRPLGSGGMGDVYEAEELDSGRRIALKVLRPSVASGTDRARFIREGRLAAALSHPHTIYIYGTDEIEQVPVIAMELATGGTLRDLVKLRGPLAPPQAVDAILQVAEGLEAAANAGILHRDIKPSNCFIDNDGRVKVGDFGLSISILSTDERSLTMLGTMLGTPAFASPEQLRSDDLDLRSDIYSVGATLYYLLTGHPPFDDANLMRLVTRVAQESPAPPDTIRPEVPAELAAVVMRCLAKRPGDRYPSYPELRAALEPFTSTAPRPPSPGIRFIAGVCDNLLLSALAAPFLVWGWDPLAPGRQQPTLQLSMALWLIDVTYYGVLEGRFGRALGKHLFGLRVIGATRERPGIPRSIARATVWTLAIGLPMVAYAHAIAPTMERSQNTVLGGVLGFSFVLWSIALSLLMFVTARRANGYAGVHDLLTATRVVMKPEADLPVRPAVRASTEPAVAEPSRIGPYLVLDEPAPGPAVVGYDDQLRRRVWIRQANPGDPPVPPERRMLSRSGRLRWLSGRRTEREAWDSFEAPDGVALATRCDRPLPWEVVRVWLLDLATEIRAGLADGTLPALRLDRVWITDSGRARLLDWQTDPARAVDSGDPVTDRPAEAAGMRLAAAQALLYEVAARALGTARTGRDERIRTPLPLGARSFVDRLQHRRFDSADHLVTDAAALEREPATFGRARRVGHLALCGLPQVILAVFFTSMLVIFSGAVASNPPLNELTESLQRIVRLDEHPAEARAGEVRAFEIHVAARYRQLVDDPATWSQNWSMLRFDPRLRAAARRAVTAHPAVTPDDIQASAAVVGPYLAQEHAEAAAMRSPFGMLSLLLLFAAAISVPVAAFGLVSALIVRGGVALRLFGAAVVTSEGNEVGRLRSLWRAAIAWSPAALAAFGVMLAQGRLMTSRDWVIATGASAVLFSIGAAYAVRHPERGLQDRLAGTTLVPR